MLYTDGLVERRGRDMDTGTAALLERLRRIHTTTTDDVAATVVTDLAADAEDDVVVLAVRR